MDKKESLPRVFGRYLLVERLSAGGMGEIFLARHGLTGFEKLVVIKKILPHLAADDEFLTRFVDEAQVAVQLQHANVAQVYEVGRVEDEYFLALEYVAGNDLRATLVELDDRDRAMPVELSLFIAREAASGLAYAHRRADATGKPLSVVHCDISPPNIVMSFDGEVKIIDFGIARSAHRLTETNPNRGFGKFGYLAPEQLLKGQSIDARTDVYALGVVLYEMLTGERMFAVGENPDFKALAQMVITGRHPLPSDVNAAFRPYDPLVTRALKPDAADRFQTAAEFRDAIQRALVAAGPTTNADHLGALITELFAGTSSDRRGVLAEIDRTELEHWRREVDNQSTSTISFALARGGAAGRRASSPPPEPAPDAHDRFDLTPTSTAGGEPAGEGTVVDRSPVRAATDPDAIGGDTDADTGGDDIVWPPRRRRWRAWVAAGAVLVGGAGIAWAAHSGAFGSSSGGDASDEAARAAASGARAGEHAAPEPMVHPLVVSSRPSGPVAATAPPGEAEASAPPDEASAPPDDASAPPDDASASPPTRSRAHRDRRHARAAGVARKAEAPSAAAVQARFRAASREYVRFKERFGARLEAEWNELAHMATYERSDGGMADLDHKIGRFRARMRAEK